MASVHRQVIPLPSREHRREAATVTGADWWHELAWVVLAAVVGFAASFILVGVLELSRSWFILAYAAMTVPLFIGYVRWSGIDLGVLMRRRLLLGVAGGLVVGAFLVFSVLRQDEGARASGLDFAFQLAWWGVVYGLIDALLLSVLPVLAAWRALKGRGWTATRRGKIASGVAAVAASMLVTAAYHAGFPEFRDADIVNPLIGDVMSVGYVLTSNPLTAMISHVAMHIAAVIQGADATSQLPPHY